MVINYTPIFRLATFRWALKWAVRSTLAAIWLLAATPLVWGQQPPPGFIPGLQQPVPAQQQAPGQAPGQAQQQAQQQAEPQGQVLNLSQDLELRVHLVLLDRMSYELHPFYQITGDTAFFNGNGASAPITSVGNRESDQEASSAVRLIHALPPFGVEGVRELGLPFPRASGSALILTCFPSEIPKRPGAMGR